MKWLKKYKVFESVNWDEFSQTIKDLFMDLYDKDYTIDIFPSEYTNSMYHPIMKFARIEIRKLNNDHPLWTNDDEKKDFDAVILDILRYVVSEGYTYECKMSSLYPNSPGIKFYKIILHPKEETKKMPDCYNK
jgi:hypothetical protein